MVTMSLTRRRTQLALLEQVCASRTPARVCPAGATEGAAVQTYFLAIESDALLLEWPDEGAADFRPSGQAVDVYFEHDGDRFALRTHAGPQCWYSNPTRGQIPAWWMALPLRVERRQQRADYRVKLDKIGPVPARFTTLSEPDQPFDAWLHDISTGGLLASAPRDATHAVRAGDVCWITFELPEQSARFEFVARVAHKHEDGSDQATFFGCRFCPGDDETLQRDRLRRIAEFVANRQQQACASARSASGGSRA